MYGTLYWVTVINYELEQQLRKQMEENISNKGYEPNEQNYHYDMRITISIMKFIKQNKQKLIDVVKLK